MFLFHWVVLAPGFLRTFHLLFEKLLWFITSSIICSVSFCFLLNKLFVSREWVLWQAPPRRITCCYSHREFRNVFLALLSSSNFEKPFHTCSITRHLHRSNPDGSCFNSHNDDITLLQMTQTDSHMNGYKVTRLCYIFRQSQYLLFINRGVSRHVDRGVPNGPLTNDGM